MSIKLLGVTSLTDAIWTNNILWFKQNSQDWQLEVFLDPYTQTEKGLIPKSAP